MTMKHDSEEQLYDLLSYRETQTIDVSDAVLRKVHQRRKSAQLKTAGVSLAGFIVFVMMLPQNYLQILMNPSGDNMFTIVYVLCSFFTALSTVAFVATGAKKY